MENHGRDWASLPKHLLDMVLEKLEPTRDCLRFGAVCVEWHSTLKHNQIIKIPRHKQMPMLLVPDKDEPSWSIYDIVDNRFLDSKLSIPYDKRFCGSSQGWLVAIQEDYMVTVYKPFSMVKQGNNNNTNSARSNVIHLPCLFPPDLGDFDPTQLEPDDIDFTQVYDFHVLKAVIIADPLENPNECIIVVLYEEFYDVAFIRLADKDPMWVRVDCEDGDRLMGDDIIYYKNQFYALDVAGDLHSFDVTGSALKKVPLEFPNDGRCCNVKRYVVESSEGKLLQVERHFGFHDDNHKIRKTEMFKVYVADFDGEKWIELQSLGDDALFLGDNSSMCVKASNFIGCQRDCIYFTHDPDYVKRLGTSLYCDVGIYHVQTRELEPYFGLDSTALNSRPPIWVVPTFDAN